MDKNIKEERDLGIRNSAQYYQKQTQPPLEQQFFKSLSLGIQNSVECGNVWSQTQFHVTM